MSNDFLIDRQIDMPGPDIFIGGEWRKGRGEEITSIFPADRSVNRVFSGASAEDVDEAIARAQEAASQTSWRHMLAHQRAAILYRIAEGLMQNADKISEIQSRDTGKTLKETKALALSAAGTFRYFAAVLETFEESIPPARGAYLSLSRFEPIGVVSAITPWNSPIASDAQKVAPALAAGNAVLLKPASWSPLVALAFARIVEEAGLPKGLLSVLPGGGGVVGEKLVTDPAIGRISFTGSSPVGHGIALKAAQRMVPVSLELGGKSPTIVFDDADIDVAIAGILYGIYSSSGQSCIAGSRLLVQDTIYKPFVERLVAATRALRVGHPFDPATQIAPLIHDKHRDEVAAWVERARQDGGRILVGGHIPQGAAYDRGIYFMPTIIDGLDNHAAICREEVFGPVLSVMPFKDEAEAISIGEDNQYGLACGVWTKDIIKALRVGEAITSGTVWINTYKQFSIAAPFGGQKESGAGREKGIEGLRAYMVQKSYYIDTSQVPNPWARLHG